LAALGFVVGALAALRARNLSLLTWLLGVNRPQDNLP
jgi:hypothetical protein